MGEEGSVDRAPGPAVGVRPDAFDPTSIEHDDEVGAAQGARVMGDAVPLLREVGVSVAVANAVVAVRNYCDYTTLANGGFGAVREVCDLVLAARAEAHL